MKLFFLLGTLFALVQIGMIVLERHFIFASDEVFRAAVHLVSAL